MPLGVFLPKGRFAQITTCHVVVAIFARKAYLTLRVYICPATTCKVVLGHIICPKSKYNRFPYFLQWRADKFCPKRSFSVHLLTCAQFKPDKTCSQMGCK